MFIVRFERADNKPKEEYFYPTLNDAKFHFNLFKNDDSNLYNTIYLIKSDSNEEILETITF